MAIPPEPIEDLLQRASVVVDGEVEEVLETGPEPPPAAAPGRHTSAGHLVAAQTVRLKVRRVLKGAIADAAPHVVVTKPVAGYALRAGNHGAFFLATDPAGLVIVGRYGPDTYRLTSVEHALGT